MELETLQKFVAQGESETLEFKKTTGQLRGAFETLCAFLNSKGGQVLIGVTDSGKLVGQAVTDKVRQEIAIETAKLEPPALLDVQYLSLQNDNSLIVLEVQPGHQAPYVYDGRPYQRTQSVTERMPQVRYDQLVARRQQLNYAWERFPAPHYSIDKLDANRILMVVRSAAESRRLPEMALHQPIALILEQLDIVQQQQCTQAAVALFGTTFLPDYPQCQLKMARFAGLNRHAFLDNQLIYGNLFDCLDNAMAFIRKHLPVAATITANQLARVEQPLIPFQAIREALINALCHRDYSILGSAISLAIYEDRMEISSQGGLPPDVTLEKIKAGFSRPRNPLIAEVLYRCNLVEKWGRGIQEMIASCKAAGDPEPEFQVDAIEFKVIFRFPQPKSMPQQQPISLSQRQQEILAILASAEALSVNAIRQQLTAPPAERTLRDDLTTLKKQGLIGSQGHARTTVWFKRKPD